MAMSDSAPPVRRSGEISIDGGAMKYVLLFCGTAEDQAAFDALPQDDLAERYAQVGRWFARHGGAITAASQLQPRETATTVRLGARDPLVIDGPFLEGNELIGGYAEIDVAGLDQALAMAKSWPGGGAVEIRPVVQAPRG
jgi:hypothetical protein